MRSFPTVFVFYLLLVTAAFAQDGGIWSKRIEDDARREPFTLTARKPNYILVTHMEAPNQAPFDFAGSDLPAGECMALGQSHDHRFHQH